MLEPSATLFTARNLFALDHISKHGPIKIAEFKKIWAEIDGDTKKHFEALAKSKKAAK